MAITIAGFAGVLIELAVRTDDGPNISGFVAYLGVLLMPIAIGIAVTRYRLYEIDRIISRTLSYGLVTVTLALVFVGGVLGLQAVLAPFTRDNTIAVAASTLVVAALFQPLRRRVQRAVDRRFDRARYDGQKVVDAFGGSSGTRSTSTGLGADLARHRRRRRPPGQRLGVAALAERWHDDRRGDRGARWAGSGVSPLAGVLFGGSILAATDPINLLFFLGYGSIGALLVVRRPSSAIGWLLLLIAFAFIGTTPRPGMNAESASSRRRRPPRIPSSCGAAAGHGYGHLPRVLLPRRPLPGSGHLPVDRWRRPIEVSLAIGVMLVVLTGVAPRSTYNVDGGATNS